MPFREFTQYRLQLLLKESHYNRDLVIAIVKSHNSKEVRLGEVLVSVKQLRNIIVFAQEQTENEILMDSFVIQKKNSTTIVKWKSEVPLTRSLDQNTPFTVGFVTMNQEMQCIEERDVSQNLTVCINSDGGEDIFYNN
jgi:hypothetical protein